MGICNSQPKDSRPSLQTRDDDILLKVATYNTIKDFVIIDSEIGSGSFGKVMKVKANLKNSPEFAVKMIDKRRAKKQFGGEAQMNKYKNREVEISFLASKVDNCIKMYTYFEEDEKFYFVYELCPDGDLEDYRLKHVDERMTEVQAKPIITQLVKGLSGLHGQNIVHRDIKTDNVLIVKGQCRICDFGAARLIIENDEFTLELNDTFGTTQVGSGFYKSPEMMKDERNGKPTDVWSLGITIGVILGLKDVCLSDFPDYEKGIPQFIKDCAAGKHDEFLKSKNIFLSHILKDLLSKMLMVN